MCLYTNMRDMRLITRKYGILLCAYSYVVKKGKMFKIIIGMAQD